MKKKLITGLKFYICLKSLQPDVIFGNIPRIIQTFDYLDFIVEFIVLVREILNFDNNRLQKYQGRKIIIYRDSSVSFRLKNWFKKIFY